MTLFWDSLGPLWSVVPTRAQLWHHGELLVDLTLPI